MPEILSPSGSREAAVAAVQNGADAIYLGLSGYNARKNAANFTEEEFAETLSYCRVRGVKAYLTLNTLSSDRELHEVCEAAVFACRKGIDAVIVQDLGVLRAIKQIMPELPIHASTQMGIHNLEGVRMAAAMGASRVILARELSYEQISYICGKSPVEIEVFVHGALCMCYSGQCYMSAVIGRRSGNRGLCAQPCRLSYGFGKKTPGFPLSLKDYSLISHLDELQKCGVASLKIEGRMKRPEYVAIVTSIFSAVLREKREPTPEELEALSAAFSREGFTDGYWTGETSPGGYSPGMMGIRREEDKGERALFSRVRKEYLNRELQRVPVRFYGIVKSDRPVQLAVTDDMGNTATASAGVPSPSFTKELSKAALQTQLYKTGGTPYICEGVKSVVDNGLNLPVSVINDMRRKLLDELSEQRAQITQREIRAFDAAEDMDFIPRTEPPELIISVMRASQLLPELASMEPALLYLPIEEIIAEPKRIEPFLQNGATAVAAVLPRILWDGEQRDRLLRQMKAVKEMGISQSVVSNLGLVVTAKALGFTVRGDFGLNVYNSQTLQALGKLGLSSCTLSFELSVPQIRDIAKTIDTEILVYGRLPLMITENCVIKNALGRCSCDNVTELRDRRGGLFPVVRDGDCRNVLLNSQKLFLADRQKDYQDLGLWGARLYFTTENARECVQVTERYLDIGPYEPHEYTRGLYYRGVF